MTEGGSSQPHGAPGGAWSPWAGTTPQQLAPRYYDTTTWVYRLAWGSSFHFAPLRRSETRRNAIRTYERYLAERLEAQPRSVCLDLGCGIGGPAFTVAQTTGARIVGINSSPQQLRVLSRRSRHGFRVVGADYARLPFPSDRFDRAYAFEALCHAVDLEAVFREVRRVLRRGSRLAFSEWCLTDRFDSGDVGHEELRRTIEASYGVVRLRTWREWEAALDGAGFCIDTSIDRGVTDLGGADEEPWYKALQPRDRSLDSLTRDSRIRRWSATVLTLAERCGLASPGTTAMIQRLREGTAALIEAGERGIFTPMRFVVATAGRSR